MADIFVSYTSSDRDWAAWLGKELEDLGHHPHVHEWEIAAGADIYGWMEQRHDGADHVLCVVSDEYLKAPYSTLERNAALWQNASRRPGFVLFVVVKKCRLPTLTDQYRRCELFDLPEEAARQRFREFMKPRQTPKVVAFPENRTVAVSNVPIRVPEHFLGRDDALANIERSLARYDDRVVITALRGLRGVGKTTLAAAYAERHRADYRATWWINAQSEAGIRSGLTALGARLAWIAADEKEEQGVAAVMERLRHEGEGILLIYDNAPGADTIRSYLPRGAAARVIVTSNAHAWRGIAEPVEIRLWPKDIGADYLVARTGRRDEYATAACLSEELAGLPLAHEQAAAYCERLDVSIADYMRRFAASPERLLDTATDAPIDYHDRLTVAKTFTLAIEEAAKLHPNAEPLIVCASFLPADPIPIFAFESGFRSLFASKALAAVYSQLRGDGGLDEALSALRAFALIEREAITDERDPTVSFDCIRLHRLVREVAAARRKGDARHATRRLILELCHSAFPYGVLTDPSKWPRSRRMAPLLRGLVGEEVPVHTGDEVLVSDLLSDLALFRQGVLGASAQARPLIERALALRQDALGADDAETANSLDQLANLMVTQGESEAAQPLFERAAAIHESRMTRLDEADHSESSDMSLMQDQVLAVLLFRNHGIFGEAEAHLNRILAKRLKLNGPNDPKTAGTLHALGELHEQKGDLAKARSFYERALNIREKSLDQHDTKLSQSLTSLGLLLRDQGALSDARLFLERALAISEAVYGPDHFTTAADLRNLALLLSDQGDFDAAKSLLERALAIREKKDPASAETGRSLNDLAFVLWKQQDYANALPLFERSVTIWERQYGPDHPNTATGLNNVAFQACELGDLETAKACFERALAIRDKALGPSHPETATSLLNLGSVLQRQSEFSAARSFFERALSIRERVFGADHPETQRARKELSDLREGE